jgi:hypothetical protein
MFGEVVWVLAGLGNMILSDLSSDDFSEWGQSREFVETVAPAHITYDILELAECFARLRDEYRRLSWSRWLAVLGSQNRGAKAKESADHRHHTTQGCFIMAKGSVVSEMEIPEKLNTKRKAIWSPETDRRFPQFFVQLDDCRQAAQAIYHSSICSMRKGLMKEEGSTSFFHFLLLGF